MTRPRYQGLQGDAFPVVEAAGGKAKISVISGVWGGATGPIESLTGNFMSLITAQAGAELLVDGLAGRNVFLYLVSGRVRINGADVAEHNLVELDTAGDALMVETTSDARLLFGHGDPISEPVVSYGPFVMNTNQEIYQAVEDFQAGRLA
jgi:redox-sensitive bicupin YhaK (pirin superfamily)